MKKEVAEFCKKYNLTEGQFYGKEEIGGYLDLESYNHPLPDGFNPTIGGYLDLRSYNHPLPDGFNPTIGGNLDLGSSSRHISSKIEISNNFIWEKYNKKFALIDGLFCEIITTKKIKGLIIYTAKRIASTEMFYIVNKDTFFAHGKEFKKAVEDLEFKIISEKLKKEPINKDTLIDVKYYRLITGACELGVNEWMNSNGIKVDKIKAIDLLPILEKTNAYGLDKFKQLITF